MSTSSLSGAIKIRTIETKGGVVTMTIELPSSHFAPYLEQAAKTLSTHRPIPGFRPGAAPASVVSQHVGRGALLEEAADAMVRDSYTLAIQEQKFTTIGSPKISVELLAPDNPFVYTATVSLLPDVTVGNVAAITLEEKPVEVTSAEVDGLLQELQKMQTKEEKVERVPERADKVVVDLDMTKDGVPIEGGTAKGHHVYLSQEHYIPGLAEVIVGTPVGQPKTTKLHFPANHYQKNLADTDVDVTLNVKEVYALSAPEVNDEFAKKLGQNSLQDLRTLLEGNVREERRLKEEDRQEHQLLEALVKTSTFGDIPEELVASEVARMLEELEDSVTQNGGEFSSYLESIKKTRDDLALDFAARALERVKTALLLRVISIDHELSPTQDEIDDGIDEVRERYKTEKDLETRLADPTVRDQIITVVRNRKVIGWLKSQVKKNPADLPKIENSATV